MRPVVDRLHDRVFAAGYAAVQRASEAAGMREHRRALVAEAAGRVVEPGAGTGLNLAHYGPGVDEVLLLDPSPAMRAELTAAAEREGDGRFRVADGTFEAIPLPDASVDVVVATFVLCSVADPGAALHEAARVLRPGGRYLGLEHVRSARPATARAQRAVAPAWRWAARGCRCDQDAIAVVDASPLAVVERTPFRGPRQPWPVRPGVRIVAERT